MTPRWLIPLARRLTAHARQRQDVARYRPTHDTPDDAQRARIRTCIAGFRRHPVFMIVAAEPSAGLEASLRAQLYPHWRLAAEIPAGAAWDFLLRLPAGVRLAETALFRLAQAAQDAPEAVLLHADTDRMDSAGQRSHPCFMAPWEADLGQAPPVPIAFSRAAMADAMMSSPVRHVPFVLFHFMAPIPVGPSVPVPGTDSPLVSIIIPSRDRAAMLARCVADVLDRTAYPRIEVIVVDNDSRTARMRRLLTHLSMRPGVRVLAHPGPFNWSAMNNAAARHAQGDVLVLLNNDIRIRHPDWLREMVALALRPEIGAVGAKLLYPNGHIQHAGISLGAGAVAWHVFRHEPGDAPGHAGMLRQRRSVAAVTGACLAIRRAVFMQVGGLEETHLGVTNGDIDLCLRVRAKNHRVVWTPFATLEHHEAATRGLDSTPAHRARLQRERAYLMQAWGKLAQSDPYLNPNLTVMGERLALSATPRA